jgi:uncharacterized phage protein gp47/JayE
MRFDMGTQEEIIQRINERLTMPANLLEGGFSQDIIGSVAYELANIKDVDLDAIADRVFVKTAKGEDLDKVGADYGIARRQSAAAYVYLEIEGTNGAIVNQNVKAVYNNLVFTCQEYKRIGESGSVSVKAKCETLGTIGNVPANTITEFLTTYQGLISVNNPDPAYDGFDIEDDETYRQRILDYLAEDATNANEAQYGQWAMSVTGVQKAVIKSAETMGAGNVGVYISAIDSEVSQELINSVKSYIESVQPINATLIVSALNYVDMDVSATIVLKTGYTIDEVGDEFTERFAEYLKTIENVVSYFKVSDLLYACSGVEDVTTYTLNNDTVSVELDDTDYAVVGEVTIAS